MQRELTPARKIVYEFMKLADSMGLKPPKDNYKGKIAAHPYYIAQTAYLQGVEDSGVELPPPVLVYCLANRDIATLLEAMQMSERAFEASMKGANNVRF